MNKAADQWVTMDASYKQYQELPGLDPDQLAQDFVASGMGIKVYPAVLQSTQTQTVLTY